LLLLGRMGREVLLVGVHGRRHLLLLLLGVDFGGGSTGRHHHLVAALMRRHLLLLLLLLGCDGRRGRRRLLGGGLLVLGRDGLLLSMPSLLLLSEVLDLMGSLLLHALVLLVLLPKPSS
jgi:hypothetical protein